MHYVYIIKSEKDGSYYKGYSTSPNLRVQFHNAGLSPYTSKKMPWLLVAILFFDNKKEALQKEKKLKKYNTTSLEALIKSHQNKINDFGEGLENR